MRTTARSLGVLVLTAWGCAPGLDVRGEGLALESAGAVVEGEFVISKQLTDRETEFLGLVELDWDERLGAGLYLAPDGGVSADMLARALAEGSKGFDGFVENNRPVSLMANDPFFRYQWHLAQLDIEAAWDVSTGAGAKVAVIDTGVSWSGADRPANLVAGWDYVDGDADPTDENGHGTHVAGTVAQATNNGYGGAGVAPDATVVAYRVLDRSGGGSTYDIARAIVRAADDGCDVANLSLGSAYQTSVERSAVQYASDAGMVVVAASGNEYASQVSYPAAYDDAIAVGAVRYDRQVAAYSNGGTALDVVAPGGDLGRDQNGDGYADGVLQETIGGYQFMEGTSMASPHVAGVAALLVSAGAEPQEVRGLLTATATDVGSTGWDSRSGFGLIDPVAALAAIDAGSPSEPDPDPEPAVDNDAPVITGEGGSRSSTRLTLTWTTDEPATTQIEFDGYGVYGNESLVSRHEITFRIDQRATYEFRFVSTDEAGNTGRSVWWVSRP